MSGVIIHIEGIYTFVFNITQVQCLVNFLNDFCFPFQRKAYKTGELPSASSNLLAKVIHSDELSLVDLQVYHLSSVRLRDLCTKLDVHEELRLK